MPIPRVRSTKKRFRTAAAISTAVLAPLFLYMRCDMENERGRREIPLVWARLAPYPATASNLQATTEGSAFSRAFRVSFSAPTADIERWIQESPGPSEAKVDHPSPRVRHFEISPGGGAQHAEMTVDDEAGMVRIYVYWS